MAVIKVKKGESIQAAVTAASPGDTIRVAEGKFNETVVIPAGKDRLRIIGKGIDKTILDGKQTLEVGIHIQGSTHVTIEHLTVKRYGDGSGSDDFGIKIDTSDNIIRKVKVKEIQGFEGITVSAGADRNLIIETISTNNLIAGIRLSSNNNYVIRSQFINNGSDAIVTTTSSNNILFLENQLIGNDDRGFHIDGLSHLFIYNLVKENNLGGFDNFANSNELIFENRVERNGGNGIEMGETSVVWGNIVKKNSSQTGTQNGIRITGDNNRIIKNRVEENRDNGIGTSSSSETGNIIDKNKVEDNKLAGIFLNSVDTNNAVRENRLDDNNPDIQADPPADVNNVFDENDCDTSFPPNLCDD